MAKSRNVFVIHGRDEQARLAVFDFLRSLDLRPLEWEELVRHTGSAAPFLGDVVAGAFEIAQAGLVLLTPDDVARLHPAFVTPGEPDHEVRLSGQARPNVLFEAGMALALQPRRTVIVEIGRLRPFADLAGRNVVRLDGSAERSQKVVQRLKDAGCAVNDCGADWLSPGRFGFLEAYARSAPGSLPAWAAVPATA